MPPRNHDPSQPARKFGGRTRTTWPAKWQSGAGVPIRFPRALHKGLTAIAHAADEASNPALALAEMLALWQRRGGATSKARPTFGAEPIEGAPDACPNGGTSGKKSGG